MHLSLLITLFVVASTTLALPIPNVPTTDNLIDTTTDDMITDPATGISFPKGWYLHIVGLPLPASVADTDAETKEKEGKKRER
jgi:hypothetical protein